MTTADFDAIIVGSGPAGVSAAFPLVEAGFRVLMVDVGKYGSTPAPQQTYKEMRIRDPAQWVQSLGRNFEALSRENATAQSPKLRIPRLAFAFEGYAEAYRLVTEGCAIYGSLAAGGFSNAWGSGVACFDDTDLTQFPITASDLAQSYRCVIKRIGVSGAENDDLTNFYGAELSAGRPTGADATLLRVLARYRRRPAQANRHGIVLGRCRHAVLTSPIGSREACADCGQCLLGCARNSIYNSTSDLESLRRHRNFKWLPRTFVEKIESDNGNLAVVASQPDRHENTKLTARRIFLAAGAIGTAAIVLRSLNSTANLRLLSTPAAAFALWLPEALGKTTPDRFFALGELAFTVTWSPGANGYAFGALFSTHGLPVSEFINHFPISRRTSGQLVRRLLPSIAAGNCFMPADLSDHRLHLSADNSLIIRGGFKDELFVRLGDIRKRLARSFSRYGAWLIPGSFMLGKPGADIHYAGTIPMRERPAAHESSSDGEVGGLPGVYVVDGAALSALPAKSHTLTIMANADRIATNAARHLNRE
jgi:choline dehydrogenase-like flavoprotein